MRMLILAFIIIFTLAIAYIVVKDAGNREETVKIVQEPRPNITEKDLGMAIHEAINGQRKINGLKPLELNAKLELTAARHSTDMAVRNYFAHVSPEGYDLTTRYANANFSCAVQIGDIIYAGAENIYIGNLHYSTTIAANKTKYYNWNTKEAIASTAVSDWMGSEYHRKNILTPHWTREGIGIYFTLDNRIYITENFC